MKDYERVEMPVYKGVMARLPEGLKLELPRGAVRANSRVGIFTGFPEEQARARDTGVLELEDTLRKHNMVRITPMHTTLEPVVVTGMGGPHTSLVTWCYAIHERELPFAYPIPDDEKEN